MWVAALLQLLTTPAAAAAKIEHYVMLLMENRATDHTFGCMMGEGLIDGDGIDGTRSIRKSALLPALGNATVTVAMGHIFEHG
jgi:phospholipase C